MSRKKRLYKSKKDKLVFGVIGGISDYLSVDSTLLRIIWLVIVSFTGFAPGIITYIVAGIIVPSR
jgi:phage shock protein C